MVLLAGEPGIGKSRLVRHLLDDVRISPAALWQFQCSSQYTNSALYPVINHLERVSGFAQGDSPQRRLDKLREMLTPTSERLDLTIALLTSLLSIPYDDTQLEGVSAQRRKDQTLQTLLKLGHNFAVNTPLLMVFEDVHWSDPTTLELLDLIVDSVHGIPVLVLISFRPDYSPSWVGEPHVTLLTLNRLSDREGSEMVARLVRDTGLGENAVKQIIDKTDGVPLFVEELTLLLLDSGGDDNGEASATHRNGFDIPNTLQDSLTARLDQLGDARDVIQLGSAIGREFDYDLLRAVAPWKDDILLTKLKRLADLLQGRGVAPRIHYVFKHALMQEAAYRSLLKSTRQHYHARIAQSLELGFEEICEAQPELVAHHFTEAQMHERAVEWWLRAGRRALAQSANFEAIVHFESGLKALQRLPASDNTRKLELAIQTSLGPALFATRGYAAPEVQQVYARGRELCREIGTAPELFSVQWGLWAYHVVRADLDLALESGHEMTRLSETDDDRSWRIESSLAVGLTRYFLGEPAPALTDLEHAIELDDTDRDRSFTRLSGQDAVVCALTYAGLTLWMLGRHDEALARSRESIIFARALNHPFSLAYALNFGAWLCCMLREPEQAITLANEQITLSEELGFFWSTLGRVSRGWARAQRGEPQEGLEEIRAGMSAYRAPGARLSETLLLAMEAEVCLLAGHPETGLERIAEGLAASEATGERMWLAELHRLGARLEFASGGADTEAYLDLALKHAREQGASGLELRVAIDLARLLEGDDRGPQAQHLLFAARAAVTGDNRIPDLCEADGLLAEFKGVRQQRDLTDT